MTSPRNIVYRKPRRNRIAVPKSPTLRGKKYSLQMMPDEKRDARVWRPGMPIPKPEATK